MAIAIALWAIGEMYYDVFLANAAVVPIPSVSDIFWLSFYLGLWSGNDSDPGGIEEGTRSYAVAVALRPRNVEAWSGYSLMLEKQGRNEEAVIAGRRISGSAMSRTAITPFAASTSAMCRRTFPTSSSCSWVRHGR